MARPNERAVRKGQEVNTQLPQGQIQRAAQTTRALGSTRVGGWVANNSHSLLGLRALSKGLNDAMNAVGGFADRQKQADIEEGRVGSAAGESFEDQKTRGQQEGFLKAQGKKAALGVRDDLIALQKRGSIERPDGSSFVWEKEKEGWGQASQRYLQERLKGLPPTSDSKYFLEGMGGLVENTMLDLSSQAVEEANEEFAKQRTIQLNDTLYSDISKLSLQVKNGAKAANIAPEFKKAYESAMEQHLALGGKRSDMRKATMAALSSAVMEAAEKGDEDSVEALIEMGYAERSDPHLGKISLASAGEGGNLVNLHLAAKRIMNAKEHDEESKVDREVLKAQRQFVATKLSELSMLQQQGDFEALAREKAEWFRPDGATARAEKAGTQVDTITNFFGALSEKTDNKRAAEAAIAVENKLYQQKATVEELIGEVTADSNLMKSERGTRLLNILREELRAPGPQLKTKEGELTYLGSLNEAAKLEAMSNYSLGSSLTDEKARAADIKNKELQFSIKYGTAYSQAMQENRKTLKGRWGDLTAGEQNDFFNKVLDDTFNIMGIQRTGKGVGTLEETKIYEAVDPEKPLAENLKKNPQAIRDFTNLVTGGEGGERRKVSFWAPVDAQGNEEEITVSVSWDMGAWLSIADNRAKMKVLEQVRKDARDNYIKSHNVFDKKTPVWKSFVSTLVSTSPIGAATQYSTNVLTFIRDVRDGSLKSAIAGPRTRIAGAEELERKFKAQANASNEEKLKFWESLTPEQQKYLVPGFGRASQRTRWLRGERGRSFNFGPTK